MGQDAAPALLIAWLTSTLGGCATFSNKNLWQKINHKKKTKTSFAKNLGRREAVQDPGAGHAHDEAMVLEAQQCLWPEGLAVGEESTHGALQGILEGLGGGNGVEAREENVRGDLLDEGAAQEQGQAWVGGSAEGQQLLSLVRVQVGDGGGRAEGQLLLGQVLLAVGKVLVIAVGARKGASRNKIPRITRVSTGLPDQEIAHQGLSWVDNMEEMQGDKRVKTVEVAREQCKELVVGTTSTRRTRAMR